ncbi:elongation of very long chain fatty acids protein 7-like [Amphibalanus amphitrite]|uniref:elongation of very long chain fatty acids protein 7-like n=1 Tax=Amphibalanus amphitrite TaxID=1232801 RepID=UPI001C90CC6A|nr:elongation of very long chain fatty acids protein 7-like [Amphibalanus amphitrite]
MAPPESFSQLLDGLIQRRDPRTRDYLMQASPVPLGIALAAYLVLVGYGPRFMKNRPTPPLRLTMMLYNIGQVILSGYMMWEFLASRPRHSWACAPVEVTPDPVSLRLVNACWLFHVSKLVDFLDTVFLVLKKDNKRMTYLHVYHHGSMASGWWICTLYLPGGSCWIPGALNSFVHCVMYSYYLLASLGPRVRPYLWWKRYLTQLQLTQFAIILFMALLIQSPGMRCGMPPYSTAMTMSYLVVLTILFANFYIRSYVGVVSKSGSGHSPASISNGTVASSSGVATSLKKAPVNIFTWTRNVLLTYGVGCFTDQS